MSKKTKRKISRKKRMVSLQDKRKMIIASVSIVIVAIFLIVGLPLILQAIQNPFQAGDKFSFQIVFNQGSGSSGNLRLYYYNCSGLTDEEISEIASNDSNFVAYWEIPFSADGIIGELTANQSFLYRYYVEPVNYTGSYGYVAIGLNKIFLNLLPTSLFVDVTSQTYQHTLENTTETNWTSTFGQVGHAFNTWYNKSGNENISWVLKFDFDIVADIDFVNVSWFSYENQNTIKTADGNSVYVELGNFGFTNLFNNLEFKFFDGIGTTANITRLGIGYGNPTNYNELGYHL